MEMKKFEDLEIWDYVPDYKNYKVSSKGRVWSVKYKKVLRPHKDNQGYYQVNLCKDGKPTKHRIHRLVATTFYFAEDYNGLEVDHMDRDKTNNSLLNLRFCSRSENERNIGLTKTNTSGYKGIYYNKNKKHWYARIRANGTRKFLGSFISKEEAYEAYKKASQELHGDFGYAP